MSKPSCQKSSDDLTQRYTVRFIVLIIICIINSPAPIYSLLP
ncbi:hypothetical protein HMPREF1547_01747 [Blautia sp. KLE 1732]|nr:hypothetical protein HMPREF1547_01747 [Blautia sp. KLE 1732]